MEKILITGGAGFIGQRVARDLLKRGYSVRVIDNFNAQVHSTDNLPKDIANDIDLIKADIRDRTALIRALKSVDTVIHLAAETGTGQSMYEIDRYFSVNVQGTATLLDLLQNDSCGTSVSKIVVASSRAIYGEGAYECVSHGLVYPDPRERDAMAKGFFEPNCPCCKERVSLLATPEEAPFKPMSFYGLTKQIQEQAVLLFGQTRGINAFALRYQNVYGPGQSLKNPYTGILAVFSNLARQNQPIEIYEDGEESRDFVYIDDVVEATVRCAGYSEEFVGALNVGSGEATSVMKVACEIKKYFSSDSSIGVSGSFRVGDIRHNIADIEKLVQVLGFMPRVKFKEGLANFLDWVSKQPLEDKDAYFRSVNELASKGLMGGTTSK